MIETRFRVIVISYRVIVITILVIAIGCQGAAMRNKTRSTPARSFQINSFHLSRAITARKASQITRGVERS